MPYIATFYVFGRRETAEEQFETLDGALSFLTRGMAEGSLYVGEVLYHNGGRIASHEWLLENWSDLLTSLVKGEPPSTHPAVYELPDE